MRGHAPQALKGSGGAPTKTMKVTGPRKLQRKPRSGSNQQLGGTAACLSAPGVREAIPALGAVPPPGPPPPRRRPSTRHSLEDAAVALAVDGRGDSHDEQGHAVADEEEPELARALALEHAHHEEVELHALQAHPAKGGQEAIVQQPGHQAAPQPHLMGGGG